MDAFWLKPHKPMGITKPIENWIRKTYIKKQRSEEGMDQFSSDREIQGI